MTLYLQASLDILIYALKRLKIYGASSTTKYHPKYRIE